MRGSLRVARIMGVDISLHISWFVIFALVTWSLANLYFPYRDPILGRTPNWLAGFTASSLFFLTVLGHELAHGVVAKRLGFGVESITLFILGGVAAIEREADHAREEFWIAIAGPLSSLAFGILAAIFWLIAEAVGPRDNTVADVAFWLAETNVLLALFNLIPGFPMDGGRVLRAIIWGVTRNGWVATRIATWVGRLFAYALVLGGAYLLVTGMAFSAVWLIGIGWFLHSAALGAYHQAEIREKLKGVAVSQAMSRDYPAISPSLSLRDAFDRYFQPYRVVALPVVADDQRLVGILTADSLHRVPEADWLLTPAASAMVAPPTDHTITPDEQLGEVLAGLDDGKVEALPVVNGDRLVGMLTGKRVRDLLRGGVPSPPTLGS
ncbi:MAG: M50 family metallopeptidase [Chloroflexota bacterium]